MNALFISMIFACSMMWGGCSSEDTTTIATTVVSPFPVDSLGERIDSLIYIKRDVDLEGKKCLLPVNCILVFRGGVVSNGILFGDNTKIESKGVIFDHVDIQGTWIVPNISTGMFRDLSYVNALKSVFALINPELHNVVKIERGDYKVQANREWEGILLTKSYTDVVLNGSIHLIPNNFQGCDILRVSGRNVNIRGKGKIIGDKKSHIGNSGEWGMGINVMNATNLTITGITIQDCWGDCIQVAHKSKNVIIEGCRLKNGRRQGISIISVDSVIIKRCIITDIAGTAPEYAIDVEPDKGDTVGSVLIECCKVNNCKGGLLVYGKAENSFIHNVVIRNNQIRACGKALLGAVACEDFRAYDNYLKQKEGDMAIRCRQVFSAAIINNRITIYKKKRAEHDLDFVFFEDCIETKVQNNKESFF